MKFINKMFINTLIYLLNWPWALNYRAMQIGSESNEYIIEMIDNLINSNE